MGVYGKISLYPRNLVKNRMAAKGEKEETGGDNWEDMIGLN
jgi:hypothetical protein